VIRRGRKPVSLSSARVKPVPCAEQLELARPLGRAA
jgi:hypothetical protein